MSAVTGPDPGDDSTVPTGGRGLGRSTAVMAAGTAVSRVLGVVRGAVLAGAIGLNVGPASAFAVANWLPTMIYMLIAGGVLNAVLVPQVVRAYRSPNGQAYVDRLLTLSGMLLLGLTVVLTAAAPVVVWFATRAGSAAPEFTALAAAFALWCMPQIFFYGTYTLLGQVLNARGSFGPYMWAPVVNNIVSIAGFVTFIVMFGRYERGGSAGDYAWWDGGRVAMLAGFATLGIIAQAVVLVIPLYRSGFRYRPRFDWRGAGLGGAGRVAGWTFAALAVGQLGVLIVMNIGAAAAKVADDAPGIAGANAYTYAFAIFMLPHSLVTVSLLTALYTRLSGHAARDDTGAVRESFSYGLRTIGVYTIFATAVLAVLAIPLVRVVLPGLDPGEYRSMAPIVVNLALGLVGLGAWSLSQRIFYAYEDARGMFWIQVAMAGVVVAGTLFGYLVLPVERWVATAGAAISASYVLGAVWGGIRVRDRLGGSVRRVLQVHVRAAVAAGVAAAVGWSVGRLFGDMTEGTFGRAVVACVVVGPIMLGVYVGLLRLMRVREVDDLLLPLLSRLRRMGRSMGTPGTGDRPSIGRPADDPAGHGGGVLDVVVGRGTLLAGRYRLEQPVPTDLPGVQCWAAHDQILDRPVRAMVLREGRVRQAQDAARRAALVSDPRLLRVLDVGDHEGVPYTVTEPIVGRDLAELTANGPLPADQARAIIGEAAAALEIARRRGVHHLALRPSAVHVTPEGSVLVSGLAMDGELTAHGLGDARSTTRADTVGLVSLLYLTLTGRWPAPHGTDPGHAVAAPVVEGSPVAPAELSPAVPNDLDTLCAVTLGPHDDGPHSPAELIRELEPWGPIAAAEIFGAVDAAAAWGASGTVATAVAAASAAAAERALDPTQAAEAGGRDAADDVADHSARTVQRQSVRSSFDAQGSAPARPGTPPPAIPPEYRHGDPRGTSPGRVSGMSGGSVSPAAHPFQTIVAPVGQGDDPSRRPTAQPTQAVPPPTFPPTFPPTGGSHPGGPVRGPSAAHPSAPVPSAAHSAAPPVGAHPRPAVRPPASAAVRVGPPQAGDESFDSLIGRSAEVLTRRRFDPTPVVLAIVAIAVVIGLVMAWQSLTRPAPPIGGADGFGIAENQGDQQDPAVEDPAAGGDDAAEDPATEPPATDAPPAGTLPAIASAQMVDPLPGGDNNEHPEAVPLAIDGDPATYWYTRTYKSPTYGMKPGVGYAVTLAAPATVTTVTLNVNGTGGMVEVRSTDPSTPTQGDVLASGPMGPETVLTLSTPTQAQHIVLWFTALPQTADGSNRVELTEVTVS